MAKKLFLIMIILCNSSLFANAQNTLSINGLIKDKKEALPGAAIYVSGYKIATVSNSEGKFVLQNLAPGNYDILVQMIGYIPYTQQVNLSDKSINIEVFLKENTTSLNEVIIKPDPNRMYYLGLFKEFFIGTSPNATNCKIINSQVLTFNDDRAKHTITAMANDFLIIENPSLGYRIRYLLENFEFNYEKKMLYYAGHPTFEEMAGNNSKQTRWAKNREIAYRGSAQHFYTSLFQNKAEEEGFKIIRRYTIPNKGRVSDSLINANITAIMTGKKSASNGTDTITMSYWSKEKRKPKGINMLDWKKILLDTLVTKLNDNIKKISFKDELFVIYKNETESPEYVKSSFFQSRPKEIEKYQISVLKLLEPYVSFYENGVTANPRSTLYSGFWSYEKMADSVPFDYIPLTKK